MRGGDEREMRGEERGEGRGAKGEGARGEREVTFRTQTGSIGHEALCLYFIPGYIIITHISQPLKQRLPALFRKKKQQHLNVRS